MDDVEAGRAAFLKLLAQVDATATAVIPSAATQDNFLIALSNPKGRVFMTVCEDDLIDLVEDDDIVVEVRDKIREALESIGE